jgi:hypothetical protein
MLNECGRYIDDIISELKLNTNKSLYNRKDIEKFHSLSIELKEKCDRLLNLNSPEHEEKRMMGNFKCTECEFEMKGTLPNINNVVQAHYESFEHASYTIKVEENKCL